MSNWRACFRRLESSTAPTSLASSRAPECVAGGRRLAGWLRRPGSRCAPRFPSWRASRWRSNRRPRTGRRRPSAARDAASRPGRGENTAACSVTTRARSSLPPRRLARFRPARCAPRGDLVAAAAGQRVRGADHDLVIVPGLVVRGGAPTAVEDPLAQPADQHGMRQGHDRAIEPQMYARDRRGCQLRGGRQPGPACANGRVEQLGNFVHGTASIDDVRAVDAAAIGQLDARIVANCHAAHGRAQCTCTPCAASQAANRSPYNVAQRAPGTSTA